MGSMRDRVKKRAQENKNKGAANMYSLPDGVEFYKPKKGSKSIDILPYRVSVDNHPEVAEGELWFERTVDVHFNVGPEQKSRICPKTIKKPCPICDERRDLMKEDSEENEELIKELRPRERVLYNVIDLSDQDKGVQLMDISYFCFGKQLDEEIREGDDDYADFAELVGGKTLKIRWSEESLGSNKFVKATRIDFKDRKDYDEDILDEVIDLDKLLVVYDYETLQKELHGLDTSTEDKEEKKDKPKSSSRRKKDKDPDPEPEEEEDDNEEDVAQERERRRAKRDKKESKDKCPHGHKFGVDTDEHKDCDDCDLWVDCDDEKEKNS